MKVALESLVPYQDSVRWAMANAYFERAGIEPWTDGSIPYRATSAFPAARQHALVVTRLFVEMVGSGALGPDDDFVVMEVGAGLGLFAQNFLRALEVACGGDGQRLYARVRYLFADYSHGTVCAALARPELLPHVGAGRIIPALFDLTKPNELRGLEGEGLSVEPTVVIANYICCVVAPVLFRKEGDDYFEQHVALTTEVAEGTPADPAALLAAYYEDPVNSMLLHDAGMDTEWHKVALAERLPAWQAEVVAGVLAPHHEAAFYYPRPFVEFLDVLATSFAPNALVLLTDYGSASGLDLEGEGERGAQLYGNSTCNGVNFALFDALTRQRGWSLARSRNPFRGTHAAMMRFTPPLTTTLRRAFTRAFVRAQPSEELLDALESARLAIEAKEHRMAVRYYLRALKLDPEDSQVLHRLGEACVEGSLPAGCLDDAYRRILKRVDTAPAALDFEFLLGRLTNSLGRYDESIAWYEKSLAKDLHPSTLTNLGAIHLRLDRFAEAYRFGERALLVRPDYPRAKDLMAEVKDRWTQKMVAEDAGFDATGGISSPPSS